MSAVDLARMIGALLCAGGLVGLLAIPRLQYVRAAVWTVLTGWLLLVASLAPAGFRVLAFVAAALVASAVPALGALVAGRERAWLALIGATLAIRVPVSVGDQEASLLLPLYVAVLAGAALSLRRASPGTPINRFPAAVGAPLSALAAWLIVSSAWSSNPGEAAVRVACYVAPFALLAWLVVDLWPAHGGPAWLVGGFGAVVLGAAAVAVAQAALGRTFGNDKLTELHAAGGIFRANGPLHDPNMLGRLLAVGLVVALSVAYVLAARGERRRCLQLAAAGVLMTVGLVLTVSQSSGLALVAGIAVILIRSVGWRRILVVGGVAGVALVSWGAFGSGSMHDAVSSRERIARASDGRDQLVAGGIAIWRAHPLAGSGLGSFADGYRASLTRDEQVRATLFASHTAPVTVLAETGLVGVGLLAWLAGAAITALRRRGRSGWARWVVLATLGAIATHSLLYGALLEDPLTWVALAAGVALTLVPESPPVVIDAPAISPREGIAV